MNIEPYTLEELTMRLYAAVSALALFNERAKNDDNLSRRISAKDPELTASIVAQQHYLDNLQKKCLAGELLLEFDAHQGNNFAVYMDMAIYLRARECA